MILTLLVFFLVLFVLVIAHECGHFFAARFFGIRVDEFGFGIPPRVGGIKRGETLYSFNLLPLGGFVKIFGEEGSEASDPRSFGSKSAWARATVLVAGIFANFILAWFLFTLVAGFRPFVFIDGDSKGEHPQAQLMILDIAENSPASKAGFRSGDIVSKVFFDSTEVPINAVSEFRSHIESKAGSEARFVVSREGSLVDIHIVPRVNPPQGEGPLGVALGWVTPNTWYQAPISGLKQTYAISALTVRGIFDTFGQLFQGNTDIPVSGPVGIYKITGQAQEEGFLTVLFLMGALSVSLGVFNVLPIPGLDGGRLLFVVIETITRRRISERTSAVVHGLGLTFLILLIVLITGLDIKRFF